MANLKLKDAALLAAALEGLELQKSRIEDQIAQVRSALGRGGSKKAAAAADAPRAKSGRKRRLSAAARARIAAAQKKRWAEYRKNKAQG
jgi:hypothetical protein